MDERKSKLLTEKDLPKGAKTRRMRGLVQSTPMNTTAQAYSSRLFEELRRKMATRCTKEF